ncbi:UDP-N-acetylglucosamine--N-acetylmuramyl-(pentapeptide) pyrophosphoryl-undecaprenol N-acetylglucosamine transferase [Candidatus Kaiserbacteria bacterium]|nr:UDP-N-acetylglucosamine--N-acetylmuramyl-(pentapeptide) pyrophosphoryl-undecaprenol N-acetylglucosamine transferase [Candidatus Kaiserbacteria bacterium]
MRIVLVGGGTGGHFYPLIAVAEAIEDICLERTLIEPELFYIGPPAFDAEALLEHDIAYVPTTAGKVRRYRSILNVLSVFANALGVVRSLVQLFHLYPDAVFSTGGYAAFPTLFAARILRIPVIIYDADASPGRVSLWSSKFAEWIAIAHPAAAAKFPAKVRDRIAAVGHPVRKEILEPAKEGGHEFLKLDTSIPTVFIMGGSQGAVSVNQVVLDALPSLLSQFNVVHQAGTANLAETSNIASVILKDSRYTERYKIFGLLNTLALRMTAGITTLIVARAGSGTIFEIANWGLPAILVPIPEDVSHDQTENAFSYARSGAAVVIEQRNLSPHLLVAEIQRIAGDAALRTKMSEAARTFARPDAARKIALTLLETAISHEPR